MQTLTDSGYIPEELFSQKGRTAEDAKFDKTRPNSTTNIHNYLGYNRGTVEIQHVNAINDKSTLSMNIQNSSGLAKGAAQIQLANTINDRSHSMN